MINKINEILVRQNTRHIYIICLVLVLAVGFMDWLTGYEISFFIFYGLPIWFAAWYAGKRPGLIFAFASLACWFIADAFTERQYSHFLIPYWNGAIRLSFFIFTALALHDMKEKLRLVQQSADFDDLTGVLNVRGFRKRAAILFPLLRREKQHYLLAFIDLDNFKKVNDTRGHAEGDLVLKQVAGLMGGSLRASDIVGRRGGDEFVVFLPGTDTSQSGTVLTALKERLDSLSESSGWPVGYSIGAGIFDSTVTNIEDAINMADSLMYEVKKKGKSRVVCKDMTKPDGIAKTVNSA